MTTDQAESVVMNSGAKENYSIKLDRLSICYNESNQEYGQKTCGLLLTTTCQNQFRE